MYKEKYYDARKGIQMNLFTEIKSAVSAKEAAIFYGVKVGRGGMACCPFHSDKHPSMKLDNRFHCFGCGADGDVINFVERMFGLSPLDAARKLIADFHLNFDTYTAFAKVLGSKAV